MNVATHRPAGLRRGRVAAALAFLLFGTALGAWTVRIPAVKARLALSDGELSLALLAFAAGCIAGMAGIGRLTDRYGSGRVMVPAAFLEAGLLIPPAYMPSLASLALALFAFGLVHGTLNIGMNANAAEVQRAWGSPIMSSFHAVYSIGGFLGAVVGGLFARAGIGVGGTLLCVAALVVVLAAWSARWALVVRPAPAPDPVSTTPRATSPTALLLLGFLALCALVSEGVAADWSAVYLHDNLGSGAGFAASAYAAFAVMMTIGRLAGDHLMARFGPVRMVQASGVLAAAGLAVALLIGTPVAGIIGFGFLGAGMSCIAPQVFTAAANRDPERAGRALSTVVSIGYLGFLLGPVLIGAASTVVGLPRALVIPAVLALFVAVSATALRPPERHYRRGYRGQGT